MKRFSRTFLAITLSAGLSASAFAAQPVSDAEVSHKLDQLNTTAQVIDSRLQQIIVLLNQNAQNGVCWQNGKSYSQGAKIFTEVPPNAATVTCSIQEKTGWPVWKKDDISVK